MFMWVCVCVLVSEGYRKSNGAKQSEKNREQMNKSNDVVLRMYVCVSCLRFAAIAITKKSELKSKRFNI